MNDAWTAVEEALPEPGRFALAFYLNRAGNGRTVRAVLAGPKMFTAGDDAREEWWDEDDGEFYAPAGWYEIADNAEEGGLWAINPSHWQPLPAPPS